MSSTVTVPMTQPITPDEARAAKVTVIPSAVFTAVNVLLVERLIAGRATIKQKEIVRAVQEFDPDLTEAKLIRNHWLDFEDAYRDAGWNVEYDKPGYNESYDAYFVFQKQR